jgi:hypothetical protein
MESSGLMFMLTSLSRRSVSAFAHRRRWYTQKAKDDQVQGSFVDPWPLPNTPEHLSSTRTPPEELKVAPLSRPNETIDTLRARLLYQTRKRGTLESDLLLSTFGSEWLAKMTEAELREFDKAGTSLPAFLCR